LWREICCGIQWKGRINYAQAPDVMVAFGVEKKDRGSYQQWKENNIAPQVVFEILSPGNTLQRNEPKVIILSTVWGRRILCVRSTEK
jgi:Uma2 family endonuclease